MGELYTKSGACSGYVRGETNCQRVTDESGMQLRKARPDASSARQLRVKATAIEPHGSATAGLLRFIKAPSTWNRRHHRSSAKLATPEQLHFSRLPASFFSLELHCISNSTYNSFTTLAYFWKSAAPAAHPQPATTMATRPSESEQPFLTPQFCFNQTALRGT